MHVLDEVPLQLPFEDIAQDLRVRLGSKDAAALAGLVDRAREVARPKATYAEAVVEARREETVRIGGATRPSTSPGPGGSVGRGPRR